LVDVHDDRRYRDSQDSVIDASEHDHRPDQRLPQEDVDGRVQIRALSPERLVWPILRHEDDVRCIDTVAVLRLNARLGLSAGSRVRLSLTSIAHVDGDSPDILLGP